MKKLEDDLNSDIVEEKIITGKKKGGLVLILIIVGFLIAIGLIIASGLVPDQVKTGSHQVSSGTNIFGGTTYTTVNDYGDSSLPGILALIGSILLVFLCFIIPGLKILKPEEALVLTLFGKYYGTIRGDGFYFVNPFCTAFNPASQTKLGQSNDVGCDSTNKNQVEKNQVQPNKKISLKIMTLNNCKQKVNDALGNPIEIGIAVMWKVVDTAKAVFNVDNYKEYLSLQCDSALRYVARLYPYDSENDEGSLRGSSEKISNKIKEEIQTKINEAGLQIVDAQITYLAYAPEIAAIMLQRQQASAIIDAKKMIVDGAVGMVEMALDRLKEKNVVELDEERKAAMVSNLLVVLCGNQNAQPVVNSGSLY